MNTKMKILFANPPLTKNSTKDHRFYPNLGLLYLMSYVRKYHSDVFVSYFEGDYYLKKYLKVIEKEKPNILALSVAYITSNISIQLIKELKKRYHDMIIVCGGVYPTSNPDDMLLAGADICIIGEGEETFSELVHYFKGQIKDLKNVKGIAFKKEKKILKNHERLLQANINKLPFPSWDLVNLKRYKGYFYKKQTLDVCIISSRGCPFDCNFCSSPVWKSKKPWFRNRSPKNVAAEIRTLVTKHGIKEIYDYSDELNVSLKYANSLCEEIQKLNLNGLSMKCQLHASNVTEELGKNLRKAGFWFVHLGIESANQKTLDGIRKNIDLKQVVKACEILKRNGLKIGGFFIIFNVWEDENGLCYEDLDMCNNTYRFAKKLLKNNLLDYISWNFAVPIPGSAMFSTCQKYNLIKETTTPSALGDDLTISLPNIKRSEMLAMKNKGMILQAHYALKNGYISFTFYKYIFKKFMSMVRNLFLSSYK